MPVPKFRSVDDMPPAALCVPLDPAAVDSLTSRLFHNQISSSDLIVLSKVDLLQAVFDTLPEALLRAKGVLNLAEEPTCRTIYQRVGERWSYTRAEPWGGVRPHSSLVFIGPVDLLDGPRWKPVLRACRLDGADAVGAAQELTGSTNMTPD